MAKSSKQGGQMNTSEIRTNVLALQKTRENLEMILIRSRKKMEPGSLVKVFTACRKGNCKCTQGQKHGPFIYLNQKIDGKYKQRYVGKDSDKKTVKRVQAYMDFQHNLAELRKINKQIDSLLNLYRESMSIGIEKND